MGPYSIANIIFSLALVTFCHGEINLESEVKLNNDDCQFQSTLGRDYEGTASTTLTGVPCQKWSHTQPHDHPFTYVGDHNYCRNPDESGVDRLWCYANDTALEWHYCSVPFCPLSQHIGCQNKSTLGRDYIGTANTTLTGLPCQRWSDIQPHDHPFTHMGDG